jgi:hypothetical protein
MGIAPNIRRLRAKTRILSNKKKTGLDASYHTGLTERTGEAFFLDILSHRMSAIGIFRQSAVVPFSLWN